METLAPAILARSQGTLPPDGPCFRRSLRSIMRARHLNWFRPVERTLPTRDASRSGNGGFDPGILDRLGLVKQIIDRAPHRILDVDALARAAAMNRTKLRSTFKQVYGTTLSGYRYGAHAAAGRLCASKSRSQRQAGGPLMRATRRLPVSSSPTSGSTEFAREWSCRTEYSVATESLRR